MRRRSASCVLLPLTRLRRSRTRLGPQGDLLSVESAVKATRSRGEPGMGTTGSRKVKAGTVIVALLALAAVLALGPAATSSAAPAAAAAVPAENAVIYWSGVASSVIVIGRAPASSSVLGGMVHGAMYDAVAAIDGELKPFATGITAPPGASADAAVAQAARDVLARPLAGPAADGPGRLRHVHGGDPERARQGRRQGGRHSRCSRDAGDADRRSLRRSERLYPAAAGAGRVRADRGDAAGRSEAGVRAAVHPRGAGRLPTGSAARVDEQALRRGRCGAAGTAG